jgi:hypothetical protein
VSFNVGVECGQLVLVLVAVPLLRAFAGHAAARAPGAPALSWSIAALGVFWLGQRVAGLG